MEPGRPLHHVYGHFVPPHPGPRPGEAVPWPAYAPTGPPHPPHPLQPSPNYQMPDPHLTRFRPPLPANVPSAPPAGYPAHPQHVISVGPHPLLDEGQMVGAPPHPFDEPLPPLDERGVDDVDRSPSPSSLRTSSRVLKTSRRAEQNRLAQRAFRQRKEEYVIQLESRSQALDELQARWDESEGRRREVEQRAQALAERSLSLDGYEQSLLAREARLGKASPPADQFDRDIKPTPPIVSETIRYSGAPESVGDAGHVRSASRSARQEVAALQQALQERDSLVHALRRALEEVSGDNARLRRTAGLSAGAERHAQHEPLGSLDGVV